MMVDEILVVVGNFCQGVVRFCTYFAGITDRICRWIECRMEDKGEDSGLTQRFLS